MENTRSGCGHIGCGEACIVQADKAADRDALGFWIGLTAGLVVCSVFWTVVVLTFKVF